MAFPLSRTLGYSVTFLRRYGFIALIFLVSGCTTFDLGAGLSPSDNPVTVDSVMSNNEQTRLGASQHPRILAAYGGEYSNPKLERMVARIVGRLVAVSSTPDQTYRITILDSPNVNAFALPGGYVYITRGLLAVANDSAEVAAVIAHEMAHVTANHGILRQRKEEEVDLGNRIVSQVLSDETTLNQQTQIRGRLQLAQFSRNQELQADEIGIQMIGKAGYDPFASPRFLEAMDSYAAFRNVSGATDARLDFLASHPATPQRITLATNQARRVGAPGIGTTDRNEFLNGIDGMIFGDTADEGYVRDRYFIHPKLGILFAVPNGFTIDNSSEAVIASGPNDMAIRFDGVPMTAPLSPADYVRSGWVTGLDESTIQSVEINDHPAAIAKASNGRWQFEVVVIRVEQRFYRFLTAAPRNNSSLESVSRQTAASFKLLTASERRSLKPLRIHVVTVKPGDTVATLAQQMQGTSQKQQLFRIINALPANATVRAGDRVKIIRE